MRLAIIGMLFLAASAVQATSITIDAFGAGATILDYEGLGLTPGNSYNDPLDIGGYIHTSPVGRIAYGTNPGNGTNGVFTQDDLTYMDIVLDSPATRVGVELSTEQNWNLVTLYAFDSADLLLGSVDSTGLAYESVFAGFQSDGGAIAWIRVQDFSANGTTIAIDNLVTEFTPVPIPAAVWLFGSCLGLLGWFRRRTQS